MSRPLPYTQASLCRAIEAARKKGMRLIVRPDGSMVFEDKADNPEPDAALEQDDEVVL